jgi:hypothetical protein
MGTLEGQSNEMFGLKGELEIDDVGTPEVDHDIALIADDTLLSTFEKSLLLHQLQSVKHTSGFEPGKKHSREPTSAYALDNLKISELDLLILLLLPNRLDFEQLVFEYTDRLASLEIVVFQNVPTA